MNPDGYCGSGGPNEVWSFGEEAYEIIRRYMYVREELKPYIMKQMKDVYKRQQLSIGVAADQLPDVTLCDTVDNVSFAAMGAAMDITSEVEAWGELENYFEAPVNSARYEDKYYGVPYYSNCLAIMYNKDIFDEMGLEYPDSDWTWDDFKDMTAKDVYKRQV